MIVRLSGDAPLLPAKRRASSTQCACSRFERLVTGGADGSAPQVLAPVAASF
ncbi:MAG: hypothetical protein NTY17_07120 [Planctomycetia bacterium]|nr:hypothetical protein [Planctomycetia bacterium]